MAHPRGNDFVFGWIAYIWLNSDFGTRVTETVKINTSIFYWREHKVAECYWQWFPIPSKRTICLRFVQFVTGILLANSFMLIHHRLQLIVHFIVHLMDFFQSDNRPIAKKFSCEHILQLISMLFELPKKEKTKKKKEKGTEYIWCYKQAWKEVLLVKQQKMATCFIFFAGINFGSRCYRTIKSAQIRSFI